MKEQCPRCGSNNTTNHFGVTVHRCKDCGRLFELSSKLDSILYYAVGIACILSIAFVLIKDL